MERVFGPSLEEYAKVSRVQLALSHLSPSSWLAQGIAQDGTWETWSPRQGQVQGGNGPDWAGQMLHWPGLHVIPTWTSLCLMALRVYYSCRCIVN